MPTNANAYNTRLTDEALEKRFRDTFRSQSGAELVDDLYASGVIIPVVDFTAAAEGSFLRQDLQTAWDFTTGHSQVNNQTSNLVANSGFWQVDLTASDNASGADTFAQLAITDGLTQKIVYEVNFQSGTLNTVTDGHFVVFLRAGDTLTGTSSNINTILNVWYRQIADVYGNLNNPSGFTSS